MGFDGGGYGCAAVQGVPLGGDCVSLRIAFEKLDAEEQESVRKFWRLQRQVEREDRRARKGVVRRGG